MLDIVYFSNITENTHRYVMKIDAQGGAVHRIPIKGEFEHCLLNSYILIVPTYGDKGRGHLPHQVLKFLNTEEFRKMCVGVVAAGNRNFGKEYGIAGDIISKKLHIPLIQKIELAGDPDDVEKLNRIFSKHNRILKQDNADSLQFTKS
jgi:protein involved in ribonucleotide reduction